MSYIVYDVSMWSLMGRIEILLDEIPESKKGASKFDFNIYTN